MRVCEKSVHCSEEQPLLTAARDSPHAARRPSKERKKGRLRISQTWGKIWTCKFKKLISNPKISIQNNLLQDTQSKPSKSKDKERIPSLKRRKKFCHPRGLP